MLAYQVEDLALVNGAASASSYICWDEFGLNVSVYGNYTFGTNGVNDSLLDYSTVPGTRTMNIYPGGDDIVVGTQHQVSDMACTIVSGTAGASDSLVCQSADWDSSYIDDSGNPTGESTAGMKFEFQHVAVPVPATAWLFGSALGLLGRMRRSQKV